MKDLKEQDLVVIELDFKEAVYIYNCIYVQLCKQEIRVNNLYIFDEDTDDADKGISLKLADAMMKKMFLKRLQAKLEPQIIKD